MEILVEDALVAIIEMTLEKNEVAPRATKAFAYANRRLCHLASIVIARQIKSLKMDEHAKFCTTYSMGLLHAASRYFHGFLMTRCFEEVVRVLRTKYLDYGMHDGKLAMYAAVMAPETIIVDTTMASITRFKPPAQRLNSVFHNNSLVLSELKVRAVNVHVNGCMVCDTWDNTIDSIEADSIDFVVQPTSLKKLKVNRPMTAVPHAPSLTDLTMSAQDSFEFGMLAHIQSLEMFDYKGPAIQGLQTIRGMPNLKILILSHEQSCHELVSRIADATRDMECLQHLSIDNYRAVVNCDVHFNPRIQHLKLSLLHVFDISMVHSMFRIRQVELSICIWPKILITEMDKRRSIGFITASDSKVFVCTHSKIFVTKSDVPNLRLSFCDHVDVTMM